MTRSGDRSDDEILAEGYAQALGLLRECLGEHGFLATTTRKDNYRRVWGRDSCVMGLAGLASGEEDLIEGCRKTLVTLATHQGPHGEIPSNVDPETRRVSYGGTAGRVDADLWFLVAAGQYVRRTGDESFLAQVGDALERVLFLLGCWQFNARGLLYVPLTGDWADEYVHSGYVLYDQLLYLQALREMGEVHARRHGSRDHGLDDQVAALRHRIATNYWFEDGGDVPDDAYHEVLYEKGRAARGCCPGQHWLPFFSPAGYGYRFDTLANVFASLLGVANDEQRAAVDAYLEEEVVPDGIALLPAFHPVITPRDEAWDDLQMMFSYTFKNQPHEYHNGGLWPMVTGWYVADLAQRGETERARRFLAGIHRANALAEDGDAWSFPEFLHGAEHTPGGTRRLGWSAAGAVLGDRALAGRPVFAS